MQYEISVYLDGEPLDAPTLNRPINQIEQNLDYLFTFINGEDPFPQYTTDEQTLVIAEDQSILYSIVFG